MKSKVYLRADGNSEIGLGHVMRLAALAEMLTDKFDCSFLIQEPSNILTVHIEKYCGVRSLPKTKDYLQEAEDIVSIIRSHDIVVLDGYHFKTEYQQIFKNNGNQVVCIDDLHDWFFVADRVLNPSGLVRKEDYQSTIYTRFYLGPQYALLRGAFLKENPPAFALGKSLMICMGGADIHNATLKNLDRCLENLPEDIDEIIIVLGAAYLHKDSLRDIKTELNLTILFDLDADEMAFHMCRSRLAITSASTIAYEFLSVSDGQLFIEITADNQISLANYLLTNEFAYSVNSFDAYSQQTPLIEKRRAIFDRKSTDRLQNIFLELFSEQDISFRFAEAGDIGLYFNWANDPDVRINSFTNEKIPYEQHATWFQKKLADVNCKFYLFFKKGIPAGQVRLEKADDYYLVNFSIEKNYRGKGLSKIMLKQALRDLEGGWSGEVRAFVKPSNIASARVFESLNFIAGKQDENLVFTIKIG